jgi:hypothetical protein
MSALTLEDLARLAEAKVPGFQRLNFPCGCCDGTGWVSAWWCHPCAATGRLPDHSPAAVHFAAFRAATTRDLAIALVVATTGAPTDGERARAAVVALLEAHGVEVRL